MIGDGEKRLALSPFIREGGITLSIGARMMLNAHVHILRQINEIVELRNARRNDGFYHVEAVQVLGGDMASARYRTQLCPRVAYMPQGLGRNLYPDLTVQENIAFFSRLFGQAGQNAPGAPRNCSMPPALRRSPTAPPRNCPAACARSSACAVR